MFVQAMEFHKVANNAFEEMHQVKCQGVNLKSGCQQSSRCSGRQAPIACQGVHCVRVLISCQGEIHRQGELLKSGCSTSSECFYQVRVLIFVRVNYSSQGVNNLVKTHQGEVIHQGVKSKSGGFCTYFTAGQEAKKVVTGNATFMEKH